MSEENKISADMIADIFDIPVNGKNINDEEDDMDLGSSQASISFDDKAKDVLQDIAKEEPKTEEKKTSPAPEPIASPAPKAPKSAGVEAALKAAKKPEPKTLDMFDTLPEAEAKKVETPKAPEAPTVTKVEAPKIEPPKVKVDEHHRASKDVIAAAVAQAALEYEEEEDEKEKTKKKYDPTLDENRCTQWDASEEWMLTSPAPKYNKFYEVKSDVLQGGPRSILPKGKLDFDKYFDELAGLHCDMTVATYDPQAIYEKMVCVQQMRERAREIQLIVSRQFFLWERYIELLRGVLIQTEYVRGQKEGGAYTHMRDMEHYFCSLKALQKGTETIFKTLDAAFDVLSRQVTIIMPMKDVERVAPNNYSSQQAPKPMTPSLKKFDSLGPKTDPKPPGGPVTTGVATGW